MLAAAILFLLSLLGLLGAVNALRGPATDRRPVLRPPFLPTLLTAEAVPLRVAIHAVVALLLIWAGALDHLAGRVGLVLTAMTWVGYVVIQWRAAGTKKVVADALESVGIPDEDYAHVDWNRVLAAYPYSVPADVERIDDIEYAPDLHLDVYRGQSGSPQPALLYVHGGSWRGGNRRQQGRPLLHRLARHGWVGVSASYPLVPQATFPAAIYMAASALPYIKEGALFART